jgi:hypothetical protein
MLAEAVVVVVVALAVVWLAAAGLEGAAWVAMGQVTIRIASRRRTRSDRPSPPPDLSRI